MPRNTEDARWLRPERGQSSLVAGCVCTLICLGSAAFTACLIAGALRGGRVFDFAQEWTSARNFLAGLPVYLDFCQSVEIHLGGSASSTFRYNAHPPAAVLVALPLGVLEYSSAYVVWSALSLVCLGISLRLLAGPGRGNRLGLAGMCFLTLVLSGNSLTHQVVQGQLNLLLLALIVGAWWADRKDSLAVSGALIGVAAAVKLFPAFLIVFHLAQRQWRAVWGGAIAFLLVNVGGCLVLGLEAYRDYFCRVAPDVAKFRDTWPNASLLGFWSKLFDGVSGHVVPLSHSPMLAQTLSAFSCLAVLATTAWAVSRVAPVSGRDFVHGSDRDLAFGLCCTGMLLASPITWDHAFLLLVPAFWFAWQASRGEVVTCVLITVLAVVLLWVNPVTVWTLTVPDQFGANGHPRLGDPVCVLTYVSFQFYALLGAYLLILTKLIRRDGTFVRTDPRGELGVVSTGVAPGLP